MADTNSQLEPVPATRSRMLSYRDGSDPHFIASASVTIVSALDLRSVRVEEDSVGFGG